MRMVPRLVSICFHFNPKHSLMRNPQYRPSIYAVSAFVPPEVFIHHRAFFSCENNDFAIIIINSTLWHSDFCVLIDAQTMIGGRFQISAGICFPENQIEHFQETLHIHKRIVAVIVEHRKVIADFACGNISQFPFSKPLFQMILPQTVLLADGLIGAVASAFFAKL